jgi:exodeoxyribonuclease-1
VGFVFYATKTSGSVILGGGMSFVFYDTETTGINTSFDQILQFAAIKTDADLNIVERFEIRSRLLPFVVPAPGALRVTKMTIERLHDPATPSHYDMVRAIRAKLLEWSPAIFLGYNSLRFDEELMRQALYQTLHRPYLTNTDGNCRGDVLALVQSVSEFEPDCLSVPIGPKGVAVFKLDQLAPANGFAHENAHDALADVEATIHLCRLIRDGAGEQWSRFLRFTQKAAAVEFLDEGDPFLLTEFYFNKPKHMPVLRIGQEVGQPNVSICFDLARDLDSFRNLTDAQLQNLILSSPKPLRKIKANAAPTMSALDDVPVHLLGGLTHDDVAARAADLQSDEALIARLLAAYEATKTEYEPSPHIEQQIYGGDFPTPADYQLMDRFHETPWAERHTLTGQFIDPKFGFIAKRLIFANDPNHLPDADRAEMAGHVSSRLLVPDDAEVKWTTLTKAKAECAKMLASADPDDLPLLQGYAQYLDIQIVSLTV